MRSRFYFVLAALMAAIGLASWGAFVTSIDAGLAVPDWPTSFNSYDPFNPWPEWWRVTPVLAEHGHRLAGALVGLFTLILAVWMGFTEKRRWLRYLGWGALALVILQGVLGGLRVIWVSLDLAVVHACVAQLFFSLLATLLLIHSRTWDRLGETVSGRPLNMWVGPIVVAVIYLQIILGALLRHPGTGISPLLAGLHITWAFAATAAVVVHIIHLLSYRTASPWLGRMGMWISGVLGLQIVLGVVAYFVLLDERGIVQPSNLQVIVNSLHLVIGAALLSLNVVAWIARLRLGVLLQRR